MFGNIALLIAAYTTTKAVRDAVFLSRFDLVELSYLMMAVALVAGLVVGVYTRVTARLRRDRAVLASHVVVAVSLIGLAHGLSAGSRGLAWALYFWSSLFGLVLVAQSWLLANDLFDAREAKRLFSVIGAGGILGGVLGGALPGWLAERVGAAHLLYVVAGELVAAALLACLAWRRRPSDLRLTEAPEPPRFTDGLSALRRHPYLRLIAAMMACMTLCSTLVQWQSKGLVRLHFGGDQDRMTAFFGAVAAALSLASFALQLFGTPRLLRRYGVQVGLHFLPGGFFLGALALLGSLLVPALALPAAACAVVLADGLRFSIDKAATELLYLPLGRELKAQAKPFIDTVVDRSAGAFSGFVWLALIATVRIQRPDRIALASLVTLVVLGVWLRVIARARHGYLEAYRRLIGLPSLAPAPRTPASGRAEVQPALRAEARHIMGLVRALGSAGADARRIGRAIDRSLGRTARLLVRVCPSADVQHAFAKLRSAPRLERAGALELLDSQLEGAAKHELLEALECAALADRPAR
jgi:AAA family ATP:ADP antiporter